MVKLSQNFDVSATTAPFKSLSKTPILEIKRPRGKTSSIPFGGSAQITCSLCGIPISAFDLLGGSDSYNHPCGHKLCQECNLQNDEAVAFLENRFLTRPCPLCKGMIKESHSSSSQSIPGELGGGHFNPEGYLSKMNALIHDLEKSPHGTKR